MSSLKWNGTTFSWKGDRFNCARNREGCHQAHCAVKLSHVDFHLPSEFSTWYYTCLYTYKDKLMNQWSLFSHQIHVSCDYYFFSQKGFIVIFVITLLINSHRHIGRFYQPVVLSYRMKILKRACEKKRHIKHDVIWSKQEKQHFPHITCIACCWLELMLAVD